MKTILITSMVIITLFLSNCTKEPNNAAIVGTFIDIGFKDKLNNDLLDPSTPNHYLSDSIRLYSIKNGIKTEVFHANYDDPRNFNIYKNDSLKMYRIMVYFDTDTTLLKLNSRITDTISCITERANGNWLLKKLWYNGVLKWDDIMLPQEIIITK